MFNLNYTKTIQELFELDMQKCSVFNPSNLSGPRGEEELAMGRIIRDEYATITKTYQQLLIESLDRRLHKMAKA